jgi:hypothetical protein
MVIGTDAGAGNDPIVELCLGRACGANHFLSRSSGRRRESPCARPRRFHGLTQLRHFKLWYAGRSKNWELAGYEIEQIRKSFESVKVFYPTLGNVDMAKMIDKESYVPLEALKKAVAARDEKAFGAQFDKLTAAWQRLRTSISSG